MNTMKSLVLIVLTLTLAACGGGGGCEAALGGLASCGQDPAPAPVNQPPVANAGAMPNVVLVGKEVTLNGLDSRDPEGQVLRYSWRIKSQPAAVVLSGAETPKPSFTPSQVGDYVIELTVNDGVKDSLPSVVVVRAAASNVPPLAVAQASPAAVVLTNAVTTQLVTLDGSGSRVGNGDALTYSWKIINAPSGSTATLLSAFGVKSTFIPDKLGTYVVTLEVNDGLLKSDPVALTVSVTDGDVSPVANAGKDLTGTVGASVVLDGTGSTDANGDALSYAWAIVYRPKDSNNIDSSAQLLSDSATSPRPVFVPDLPGLYVIGLKVSDKKYTSKESFVSVTVK